MGFLIFEKDIGKKIGHISKLESISIDELSNKN